MSYSVDLTRPLNFEHQVEVAGCFCQWNNQILLLRRHPDKPQGGTWGLPAGKLETGETPKMAVIREVAEEVGLDIQEGLKEVGKIYIQREFAIPSIEKNRLVMPSMSTTILLEFEGN